jgi:prolipoprotein diacylglyceryltransferase/protein-S-isoprenylcysteine O-methyltransferase Ste14
MKQINLYLSKLLYSVAFLILLPAGLWLWAKYSQYAITYQAVESKPAGCILIIAGGSFMLWAMGVLMHVGRGFGINAYPPSIFIARGPYRLFKHPMYWGFGMMMVGCFIFTGSASGLWLVSPLTILGMIAFVLGYEEIDLKRRFPNRSIKTVLDLPENKVVSLNVRDRLAALLWIFYFLMFSNFTILKLAGITQPLFGKPLMLYSGRENPYLQFLGIVFLIAIPFFLKRKDVLRSWLYSGIFSLCLSVFTGLLLPSFGAQYLPPHNSVLFTIPVFLIFISLKTLFRQSWKIGVVFSVLASVIVLTQLRYVPSVILYLADSVLIFLISSYYPAIWIFLKNSSEKIANSWKEWIFWKVRVINHGFYVGFGTFFGVLLAGILAGSEYALALLIFALIVTICSALWAQFIEGSEKLKRPFGYYGGLVGILFGILAVRTMGYNGWVIIGVASVVMPWVQAIGRLRCLVNGCCHGGQTNNPAIGIRYFHPRSRVCNISGLKGELLHPTQLYSILWLFLVGLVLLVLWKNHISPSFIFGLYLILTGLGRFVEEAYRGETQTPIIKGLRLYQWTAVFSLIVGVVMTVIRVEPVFIEPGYSWEILLTAAISGVFLVFAMGIDFPYSNVRFSRLV